MQTDAHEVKPDVQSDHINNPSAYKRPQSQFTSHTARHRSGVRPVCCASRLLQDDRREDKIEPDSRDAVTLLLNRL